MWTVWLTQQNGACSMKASMAMMWQEWGTSKLGRRSFHLTLVSLHRHDMWNLCGVRTECWYRSKDLQAYSSVDVDSMASWYTAILVAVCWMHHWLWQGVSWCHCSWWWCLIYCMFQGWSVNTRAKPEYWHFNRGTSYLNMVWTDVHFDQSLEQYTELTLPWNQQQGDSTVIITHWASTFPLKDMHS